MAHERGRVALLIMTRYHKVATGDAWKYEAHFTTRRWCSNGHVWEAFQSKVQWRQKPEHHYTPPWKWVERFLQPHQCNSESDVQAKLDEAVETYTADGWKVIKRR